MNWISTTGYEGLPPLIKTTLAAKLLSCSTCTISDMCKKGEIKAVKVGSHWRIYTAAFLDQFGLLPSSLQDA